MALKDIGSHPLWASNVFGTLDNDDVFQYLGATAIIRRVNGASETIGREYGGARFIMKDHRG